MTMTAICILFDDTQREVQLEDLNSSWTASDVYDVCEDKLSCKIKTVKNLEDIMAEVEYLGECKEEI